MGDIVGASAGASSAQDNQAHHLKATALTYDSAVADTCLVVRHTLGFD